MMQEFEEAWRLKPYLKRIGSQRPLFYDLLPREANQMEHAAADLAKRSLLSRNWSSNLPSTLNHIETLYSRDLFYFCSLVVFV